MNPRQFQALATASATCLATLIAFALQMDDPWWAAISAWIVSHPEKQFVFKKGLMRIVGNLAGCGIGYVVATATAGWILTQWVIMVFAFSAAVYMRFTARYAYAWAMFWVILALTVLTSEQDPSLVSEFAYFRAIEIVTGVAAATFVSITIEAWRPDLAGEGKPVGQVTDADRRKAVYPAVFGGGAALLILLLWNYFALPSIFQILVSLFTAMAPTIAQMRQQISMRLGGCLLGGTLGVVVTGLGIETLWIWMMLFFVGIYFASLLHHNETEHAYIGTQAGVAFVICMVADSGPQQSILPVIDRAVGITLAYIVLACLLVLIVPWVRGQSKESGSNVTMAKG
ncbi:MAG: FUSC family protein [Stappiaceae bacterium]